MKSPIFWFFRLVQSRCAIIALVFGAVLASSQLTLCSKNSESTVWKITDTNSGNIYFAKSKIMVDFDCQAGGSLWANGTITYRLNHDRAFILRDFGSHISMAHISYKDPGKYPFSAPGAESSVQATFKGFVAHTADGIEQPVISCYRFASVRFQDMRDKRKVTISNFVADEVRESEIPDARSSKE